jgi:hypothetical protein
MRRKWRGEQGGGKGKEQGKRGWLTEDGERANLRRGCDDELGDRDTSQWGDFDELHICLLSTGRMASSSTVSAAAFPHSFIPFGASCPVLFLFPLLILFQGMRGNNIHSFGPLGLAWWCDYPPNTKLSCWELRQLRWREKGYSLYPRCSSPPKGSASAFPLLVNSSRLEDWPRENHSLPPSVTRTTRLVSLISLEMLGQRERERLLANAIKLRTIWPCEWW